MIKKALLILLCFFSLTVNAQQTNTAPTLDNKTIVRGEDGMAYPYAIWKKLMATGNYIIKNRKTFDESGKPEYLIVELGEKERLAKFEKMPKPRVSENFVEGTDFKGFKTSDINGNKIDLRNGTGNKIIVLNFWFINCPPCRAEMPQLNKLVEAYKGNPDVLFLGISLDAKSEIKDFLKTNPFDYNIIDNGRFISEKYGVRLYPTHAIIDKSGKIKFSSVSFASNSLYWMKKVIDEALVAN